MQGGHGTSALRPIAAAPPETLSQLGYAILDKVGEGAYGKVFRALKTDEDCIVAVKRTRLDEEGVPTTTLREISNLLTLREHPHVVRLLAVHHSNDNDKAYLYLVFELLTMDLKNYMNRVGNGPAHPLPHKTIKTLIYQLLKGLDYCHAHGILHRDLKPENLLIHVGEEEENRKKPPQLKIADLGLGRSFSSASRSDTPEIVTLWYRAPEVLLGCTHHSCAVDIWSVGCILGELYRKTQAQGWQLALSVVAFGIMKPLFRGLTEVEQFNKIFQILGTPTENVWQGVSELRYWREFPKWQPQDLEKTIPEMDPLAIDLLKQMLHYDPSTRISARDALGHPYFDDIDKKEIDALEITKTVPQEPIGHPAHWAKRKALGEVDERGGKRIRAQ